MDIILTPSQQTVLSAAILKRTQLEDEVETAKQYIQGLILMVTGQDGSYTLVSDETPWRVISNEMAQDPPVDPLP